MNQQLLEKLRQENEVLSKRSLEIDIQKSKYSAKLILLNLEKNTFYSVLKEKLHWGTSYKAKND